MLQEAERLAHTITDVCEIARCGKTVVNVAIRNGELKARKMGKRTIILDADLKAWINSWPAKETGK